MELLQLGELPPAMVFVSTLGLESRVSNVRRAYPLFPNPKNFVKRMIRIYTTNYYPSRTERT